MREDYTARRFTRFGLAPSAHGNHHGEFDLLCCHRFRPGSSHQLPLRAVYAMNSAARGRSGQVGGAKTYRQVIRSLFTGAELGEFH